MGFVFKPKSYVFVNESVTALHTPLNHIHIDRDIHTNKQTKYTHLRTNTQANWALKYGWLNAIHPQPLLSSATSFFSMWFYFRVSFKTIQWWMAPYLHCTLDDIHSWTSYAYEEHYVTMQLFVQRALVFKASRDWTDLDDFDCWR